MAKDLTKMTPVRRFGWVHAAMSLRKLNRVAEVRDALLPVLDRFEPNPTFPYYLACYWANLGDLEGAKAWLEKVLAAARNKDEAGKITLRRSNG